MKYFIKALLLLLILPIGNNTIFAQSTDLDFKQYTINLQKLGQKEIQRVKLQEEKAQNFDPSSYISEHIGAYDITIWGTVKTAHTLTKYRFNSKDLVENRDCKSFCEEVIEIKQKALLGVSVKADENFEGCIISTVVTKSAAEKAGLLSGDLISFVGAHPIHSPCDLTIAISNYDVGEEIPVTYSRNGIENTVPATLGYKMDKQMTWVPCCDSPIEGIDLPGPIVQSTSHGKLKLFPNPSEGISHIHFTSSLDESIRISVTNVNGREVIQQEVADFEGTLDQFLDLTKESAGVYIVNVIQGDAVYVDRLVLHKK